VSHSPILCLGAGSGHRGLALGGPGNQSVTEIDAEAGGGSSRVWAAGPISVRVGSQFIDRPDANVKTRGKSPLDEVEDALDERTVRLVWGVHEEAHLLNSIRQIKMSQRQVLKSSRQAPVLRCALSDSRSPSVADSLA
jgi:hypothetical protein